MIIRLPLSDCRKHPSKLSKMSPFVLLLHFLTHVNLCFSSVNTHLFNTWCQQHGKSYSSEEEKLFRLSVFEDNLAFVTQHNSMKNTGYTLALNDFADLTYQEFKTSHFGPNFTSLDDPVQSLRKSPLSPRGSNLVDNIATSIDWRKKGVVTPVQNEASTCSAGNRFCSNYKDDYAIVPANNEGQLLQAVAAQPVHAGICANERTFQFYSKGIFTGPCSTTTLDHGVLIVGYDSENGVDYWIVKNSWGTNWGMNGYMHILRNSGNPEGICGINTLASYTIKYNLNPNPLLQPTSVRVSCDILRYCKAGETCCCSKRFIICLTWICCKNVGAVCCDDHERCCPHGYACDAGICYKINLCFSSLNTHLFNTWCDQHGKRYSSEEEKLYRLSVFEDNLAFVMQHNSLQNFSYTLALNDFADLTHQEFKTSYLNSSSTALDIQYVGKSSLSPRGSGLVGKLPSSVDWRKKGQVTTVKNQASCSTAWAAVSVTGAIQGIKKIITESLASLQPRSKIKGVTMEGHHGVPSNSKEQLLQAVALQPVRVGICANERVFQFYSKGIFSGPCSCSSDHAVTIVGYDSENGIDYWIVKNSWGRKWGMNGDMYMLCNSGNNRAGICGINTLASHPIKPNPNSLLSPSLARSSCDFLTKCRPKETCCCIKHFILCVSYRCCGLDSGVCCDDHKHCCPNGYICNLKRGTCIPEYKNSTTMTEIEQSSLWYPEG
ncbi:Cysteine proteinase rd21a [Thalictrum thalictroides]|uniref:Cysteine proteinase rd21a n=1 Tax=Thalictrum thalictroides TaxID=46969 RepID=A0A7J6V9C9_THATH|nr:Cysteine proteinase rd21a [Thalictrum thalictroides]